MEELILAMRRKIKLLKRGSFIDFSDFNRLLFMLDAIENKSKENELHAEKLGKDYKWLVEE